MFSKNVIKTLLLSIVAILGIVAGAPARAGHTGHEIFEDPDSEPGEGAACQMLFDDLEEQYPDLDNRIHWLHRTVLDEAIERIPAPHRGMFLFDIGRGKLNWPRMLEFALEEAKYKGQLYAFFARKLLRVQGTWIFVWQLASDFNDAQFEDFRDSMMEDIMNEYPDIDPGTAELYADEMISYFRYGQYTGLVEILARVIDFIFGQQFHCMLNVQERPSPPGSTGGPRDGGRGEGLSGWEQAGPMCEGVPQLVQIAVPTNPYGGFSDIITVFMDFCETTGQLPSDNPVGDDGVCDVIDCNGDVPEEDEPDDGEEEDENPADRDGDGIPDDWEPSDGGPGKPPRGWTPHEGICETNLIQPGGKPPWVNCGGGGDAGYGRQVPQYF